jgi:excisionase family DNA binding protein
MPARFLTRGQVAEELNVTMAQAYALIRRGELRAAKIGGRGDYRIGQDDLEAYVERTYAETARWVAEHPFAEGEGHDAEV